MALPLAIAFAIASGVAPERGLYTAIIAGFIISALGGSRVQIGGPTGAFVVIVYGIVQQHGLDGLWVATLMAGVILIAIGLARLGGAIKFIPYPGHHRIHRGIALIIFSSQVKDLLGLRDGSGPGGFRRRSGRPTPRQAATVNWTAVGVSLASLAVIWLWPRVSRRMPAPFVALVAMTASCSCFHLPVETIGDRFGEIHAALPRPTPAASSWDEHARLVAPAFTIALLAGIESLLSAVVADGMIGRRHRSNMELVAQGIANIASPTVRRHPRHRAPSRGPPPT